MRPVGSLRGYPVFHLCLGVIVFALAWGCSSQGDPFGQEAQPVLSISAVTPPDGALDVSPDAIISVAFPLDLDARTVTRDTVQLLDYTQADQLPSETLSKKPRLFPAKVVYDQTSRVITIVPNTPLCESGRYQILLQNVRSTLNVLFNTTVTTFRTGRSSREVPKVVGIVPLSTQTLVLATTTIQITFSRLMDHASVLSALSISPSPAGTMAFTDVGRTVLTFRPGTRFGPGDLVCVTVRADAKDQNGTQMERAFNSCFSVEPPPRVIPELTEPYNGEVTVPRTSPIRFVFSTTMTTQTVADAFSLVYGSTFLTARDGRFTFQTVDSPPRTAATFVSTNSLPATTTIQIRVNGLAQSTRGIGLAPLFFSNFVTAQQ